MPLGIKARDKGERRVSTAGTHDERHGSFPQGQHCWDERLGPVGEGADDRGCGYTTQGHSWNTAPESALSTAPRGECRSPGRHPNNIL